MIKKILIAIIAIEFLIALFCGTEICLMRYAEQPKTFYQLESYQLAKWSKGTHGGICYQYADRLKKLFGDEVRKEHIIIRYRGHDTLTHYRVVLFENENIMIYTDSNFIGKGIINTWYEYK